MPVLMWVAILVGAWCVASVIAALALGAFLRRRGHAAVTRIEVARRIDTTPLRMWLAEMPDQRGPVVPDTPASLWCEVPRPRAAAEETTSSRVESGR